MTSAAPARLAVSHVVHRYPQASRLALDDVSFTLEPGLRLGLLGPNGAGKSTLMRILCGFLPVQADAMGRTRIEVAGHDVAREPLAVRQRVGYMPELVPLYPELRVDEHLRFRARLKGVAARSRSREIARVTELTGLGQVRSQPIGRLSRGFRQRVGLADALLGGPPLVVLDEPTVGLDPNQIREIRAMLRELGGAQTLIFSSHILPEVEALCDRVVILAQGKVVLDAPLALALAAAQVTLEVRIPPGRAPRAEAELRSLVARVWAGLGLSGGPNLQLATREPTSVYLRARINLPEDHLGHGAVALGPALGEACHDAGWPVTALVPGQTRLEERFAAVTGGREHD